MAAGTSFGVLALSAALMLTTGRAGGARGRAARALGAAVSAVSAVSLYGSASGAAWAVGLPSPHTATCLLLLGAARTVEGAGSTRSWPPAQVLALSALALTWLALTGHLYRFTPLYGLSESIGMSLPTAIATGLLAVATLSAQPDTGVVRVLSQDSAGSWLARRLLPLAVILPWAVDLTARLGAAAGAYAAGSVGPTRLVLGAIGLAGVTLTLAKSANRVDARRRAAEHALLEHQRDLEATVAARTRELRESEQRLLDDLAARKAIEAQLRVRAAALEAAHNGVAIVARDGNFEWVNPAFTRLTGYTSAEVVGKKPNLLKSGQHDAAFYHELWGTVTSGKAWQGHMINRKKDGTLYDEEQTITPVPDADGTITHFVAIKLDVSERLAAERERERLLGELHEALANVRTLSGFIPICAACKKIRNDTGYWDAIEAYISRHTDAKFSHGICPECIVRLYPDE